VTITEEEQGISADADAAAAHAARLLIEEARLRHRRRRLVVGAALATAVVVAAALVVGVSRGGTIAAVPGGLRFLPGAAPLDFSRGLVTSMSAAELVSCPSGPACVVVGIAPGHEGSDLVARLYRDGSWTSLPAPIGFASFQPESLSCATATSCVLAGYYWTASPRGLTRALAEVLQGARWDVTRVPVPGPSISSSLSAVSCASPTWCIATGTTWNGKSNGVFATVWNGSSWREEPLPLPSDAWGAGPSQASSVSCISASWCMAVGTYATHTTSRPLVEIWTGSQWQVAAPPTFVGMRRARYATEMTLVGVSCVTRTWCAVAGADSLAAALEPVERAELAIWDGRSWTTVLGGSWQETSLSPHSGSLRPGPVFGPDEGNLGSVSCSSVTRCVTYVAFVDAFGIPRIAPVTIFERDARGWFAVTTSPSDTVEQRASGVSCMTSGNCLVVGTEFLLRGDTSRASGGFAYGVGPRTRQARA
jgi:hypothetical protein